ncbi:MAG TPA: hypothetical protein PKY56_09980 [Candidatus Kapabacteria bacterium]|nr:hypothetical protein [Candidatus Kapabacteria bacterium]
MKNNSKMNEILNENIEIQLMNENELAGFLQLIANLVIQKQLSGQEADALVRLVNLQKTILKSIQNKKEFESWT